MPRIGVIGGTGVYDSDYNANRFEMIKEVWPDTEYGKPSAPITIGKLSGVEVAFLPRHGVHHEFPPTEVPYKANIMAMKSLGVEMIVSPCAVGSLKEDIKPGDMVIVDQFIDWTKCRDYSFFHDRTVHTAMPDPTCPQMNAVMDKCAKKLGLSYHLGGTYICIEGPRFSTRAESRFFKTFADVIGMTMVPECQLAREMGMCYCSIATITDYDAWKEETVDFAMVVKTMERCLANVSKILIEAIPELDKLPKCACKQEAINSGAIKE